MEEAGKCNILQKQNTANLCFQAAPGIKSAVVVPACNPLLLIIRGERDLLFSYASLQHLALSAISVLEKITEPHILVLEALVEEQTQQVVVGSHSCSLHTSVTGSKNNPLPSCPSATRMHLPHGKTLSGTDVVGKMLTYSLGGLGSWTGPALGSE